MRITWSKLQRHWVGLIISSERKLNINVFASFLINVKLIESETFKTLNIPVFLKGNEAKLLLKEKPELVKQYLDKKRSLNYETTNFYCH